MSVRIAGQILSIVQPLRAGSMSELVRDVTLVQLTEVQHRCNTVARQSACACCAHNVIYELKVFDQAYRLESTPNLARTLIWVRFPRGNTIF